MAATLDVDMPDSSTSCPLHTENGQRGVWLLKASHASSILILLAIHAYMTQDKMLSLRKRLVVCKSQVPKFVATQWRQECQKAASSESEEPHSLGRVRITKSTGKGSVSKSLTRHIERLLPSLSHAHKVTPDEPCMQAGGIELVLPASDNTGQQRSFAMRETTDNSAPSFMFADLDGRLSMSHPQAIHSLCNDILWMLPFALQISVPCSADLLSYCQGFCLVVERSDVHLPAQVWRDR